MFTFEKAGLCRRFSRPQCRRPYVAWMQAFPCDPQLCNVAGWCAEPFYWCHSAGHRENTLSSQFPGRAVRWVGPQIPATPSEGCPEFWAPNWSDEASPERRKTANLHQNAGANVTDVLTRSMLSSSLMKFCLWFGVFPWWRPYFHPKVESSDQSAPSRKWRKTNHSRVKRRWFGLFYIEEGRPVKEIWNLSFFSNLQFRFCKICNQLWSLSYQ